MSEPMPERLAREISETKREIAARRKRLAWLLGLARKGGHHIESENDFNSRLFDLLILARNSHDEDSLQEAIDMVASAYDFETETT